MLYTIVIVFSIFLIIFVRKYTEPYSPANIFTLFWTVQILIMVIGLSHYLYFSYTGIIYILCCILCFDLGYLIIPRKIIRSTHISSYENIYFNKQTALKIYYVVLGIAIFRSLYGVISKGYSLSNLVDITSFMEMSHQNSVDRYSGEDEGGGVFGKLLGVVFMACPYIGGFLYLNLKSKKYLSYLAIFPSVLAALSQGAKMGLITSIILWLIGLIISSQLFNIKIRISIKNFIFLIVGFVGFIILMGIVMLFRIGEFNEGAINDVMGKGVSYLLAHLPAFDLWYENHHENLGDLTIGAKLVYGISNLLGVLKRDDGVYTEMITISADGDITNVYTVFRFFVEDFGTFGSLIFLIVIGYISRIIYIGFEKKINIFISASLMSFIYFFIAWSFCTSIFAYTSYILLLFFLYFVMHYLIKVHKGVIISSKEKTNTYIGN